MKTYFGIFQPKRCQICNKHKATRKCPKTQRQICFHCCNDIRIKLECPKDCKFVLKSTQYKNSLQLNNYSESIAEQQGLLDLHLQKWLKNENPLFENKTPKSYAETQAGKKKINSFLKKHEQELEGSLSYNYVREQLGIPLKEKANKTHEDVANSFMELVINYDYEKMLPLLVHYEVYKNEDFRQNYLKRNLSIKAFKSIKEFDLIRSALSKEQDQAIVEFEINGKYSLSIVLKNINAQWFIKEKVFGESSMVLSENEFIQRIAYNYAQQNFDHAYKDLKKYLQVFPDSPDLHYYFGIYYSTKGKVEKAKEHFFNAMELAPEFTEAKYNYAFLFQAEGNMEKSRELYEEILEKKEEKKTLNNLAVIYEQDGQLEQSLVLLKKALELDPNFELAQKNVERINEKKNTDQNPSESNETLPSK
ncbi:MAG: tetratricopeptide repeat protein [Candidatus Celaenobacter polaris]|nr:tetratricopeptide repeat protein [Candidatus Celaenobacter polaris]